MHELTAADLRHSRLQLFWIQVLITMIVGSLLVAEIVLVPDSLPDVMDRAPCWVRCRISWWGCRSPR